MQNRWLPDGLLKRYKSAFIPSHYTPFAIQRAGAQQRRSWFTENRKGVFLTDGLIEAHLEEKLWIGPVPITSTRSVVVDLDRRGNAHSLDKRTEQVRAAFPEVEPLFFSTPGGGRHLHLMLEGPSWSDRAAAFAKDRLTDAGVELAPGLFEVFPNGKKAIRAPLGRDCYLLDSYTLDPIDGDRAVHLHTLNDILENERYDLLEIPADYGATETPEGHQKATRRRVQPSSSEFMLEVDRLERDGLWRPAQRHEALCKLSWYFHVIEGKSGDQVVGELWAWIRDKNNGFSQDFRERQDWVRRNIEGLVKAWDPGKVGNTPYKAPESPREAAAGLEGVVEGFVDSLPLDWRERAFLTELLRYAHRRGEVSLDGFEIEVEIPARTLKTWDRQYGPILRSLLFQGCVELARNYTTLGRCTTYRVPCLD